MSSLISPMPSHDQAVYVGRRAILVYIPLLPRVITAPPFANYVTQPVVVAMETVPPNVQRVSTLLQTLLYPLVTKRIFYFLITRARIHVIKQGITKITAPLPQRLASVYPVPVVTLSWPPRHTLSQTVPPLRIAPVYHGQPAWARPFKPTSRQHMSTEHVQIVPSVP